MSTDLAIVEPRAVTLTAAQVRGHVQLIQQVMESVMKADVHYGVIPGTKKPSLWKPGAEVLMTTFRIAVDPQVEDLSVGDEIRYRVRCVGTHQTSGTVMGTGIGECSSDEEKYRWRRVVCDEEFEQTPEDRRRMKFGAKQGGGFYKAQQVRTEPADVANTILKMAKKRALVDFTLTALAASDIFAQDLEDMSEELRESVAAEEPARPSIQIPQAQVRKPDEPAPDPNQKLKPGQVKVVQKALERSKVAAETFCKHFGIEAVPDLPFAKVNDGLRWISDQTPQ